MSAVARTPEGTPRVAIVTGANRGLGYETARALHAWGAIVVVAARSLEAANTAARRIDPELERALPFGLDVRDEAQRRALFDLLEQRWGRLDILVNNAGVFLDHGWGERSGSPSVLDAELETVRATLEVNTLAPFRLCQLAVPLMARNRWGRIVNVSSGMGQLSDMGPGYPAYRISKTALNAVTRILAAETRDLGIKVNSVCPGWVRTRMGGPGAPRSLDEGARGIVWAATLGDDGPTGGFFRDGEPIPW